MRRFEFKDQKSHKFWEIEDFDTWQIYADGLPTQADPWGERLSLALQRSKTSPIGDQNDFTTVGE